MAIRINDNRIGVRDAKRKVTQWPTHFAVGGLWNRMGNPTPTTCYFGPDQRYFYVLPIGLPAITLTERAELEKIVTENESPAITEVPVETPVVETSIITPVETGTIVLKPIAAPVVAPTVAQSAPSETDPTIPTAENVEADYLIPEPKKKVAKKTTKDTE